MATSYYNTSDPDQTFQLQTQSHPFTEEREEKKKRSKNPENWLKTKRKQAILAGKSYVNTKGDVVLPKYIGPDCKCKNKCYRGVNEKHRNSIFNGFYNLKSYDEQNSYLYGLIRRHDIQRKRQPSSEKRTCTYKYYVRVDGRELQVCKKAFGSIHSISEKKIRTLCLKHEQNIMFPRDNRGRHSNRPKKVTAELVTIVKQHILQVLSGPTAGDYVRTDKSQVPDVNVTKLHRNFLQLHEPQALLPDTDKINKEYDAKVKTWVYFRVFHEEFKSLEYSAVKRKLGDLRKSLEAAGVLQGNKRKPVRSAKAKVKERTEEDALEFQSVVSGFASGSCVKQNQVTIGAASAATPCSSAAVTLVPQAASVTGYNFVQQPEQQQQLQPCLYNFTNKHQHQQQPLNLQIGSSNLLHQQQSHSGEHKLFLHQDHSKQGQFSSAQAIPIVIPTNGQPYYLSLSNIPNIITVPPSSCATVINVSNKMSTPTDALITATLIAPNIPQLQQCNSESKPLFQLTQSSSNLVVSEYSTASSCEAPCTSVLPVSTVDLSASVPKIATSCTYRQQVRRLDMQLPPGEGGGSYPISPDSGGQTALFGGQPHNLSSSGSGGVLQTGYSQPHLLFQ